MGLSRRFLVIFGTVILWGGSGALGAFASDVKLLDGRHYLAESTYPSITDLVLITQGAEDLLIIPNDQVASIDGATYQPNAAARPLGELAPAAVATGVGTPIFSGVPGSVMSYALTRTTDSWMRHGQRMEKKPSQHFDGIEQETVLHGAPSGEMWLQKVRLKQQGNSLIETDRSYQRLAVRPDGYYLMAEGQALPGETLQEPILEWPHTLKADSRWQFGPLAHGGRLEVSHAQVVAQEAVSVPAGNFPAAYKVTSFSYLFAGDSRNHGIRLVTPYGTVALSTWLVPGLGVIKRDFHVHMHIDAFPGDKSKGASSYVLDDRGTERLSAYRAGH